MSEWWFSKRGIGSPQLCSLKRQGVGWTPHAQEEKAICARKRGSRAREREREGIARVEKRVQEGIAHGMPIPLPQASMHRDVMRFERGERGREREERGGEKREAGEPGGQCRHRLPASICRLPTATVTRAPSATMPGTSQPPPALPDSCMYVLPSPSSVLPPILPSSFLCVSAFPPPLPLLYFLYLCSALLLSAICGAM